jgi:hypothetical protein
MRKSARCVSEKKPIDLNPMPIYKVEEAYPTVL